MDGREATGDARYPWSSVTEELRRSGQPLRQWFSAHLPNAKLVYRAFRESTWDVRPLEPPAGVPAGTLGAAFEYGLRLRLNPDATMNLAVAGSGYLIAATRNQGWDSAGQAVIAEVQLLARQMRDGAAADVNARQRLARGCWALALLTEIARGVPFERSALTTVATNPTAEGLAGLMPPSAMRDIHILLDRAERILLPYLASKPGPLIDGPTFDAPIAADGDFIAGGSLIEIKAVVGRRRRDGTPRWGLDARTLYQIVAYGLLAHHRYGIDELALFNPRYNHLHTWPLERLLTELAGTPVRAARVSADFVHFLCDPCGPAAPTPARRSALARVGKRQDSSGEVRPATARGVVAARQSRYGQPDWSIPVPSWPLYAALLDSAATAQARCDLEELVVQATGCTPGAVRRWKSAGLPAHRVSSVRRAAAVWRMGGITGASQVFGLSPRRTMSWLAGRGRLRGEEQKRVTAAIARATPIVSLRVHIRGAFIPEMPERRRQTRSPEWTLTVSEQLVQRLHDQLSGRYGHGVNAALELLSPVLLDQQGAHIRTLWLADIVMPEDSGGAQYVLTPEGVSGPGFPVCG